jgi:hypothetical protein
MCNGQEEKQINEKNQQQPKRIEDDSNGHTVPSVNPLEKQQRIANDNANEQSVPWPRLSETKQFFQPERDIPD